MTIDLHSLGNVIRHWVFGQPSAQLFLKGLRNEIKTRLRNDPAPIIKDVKELAVEIQKSDKKLIKDEYGVLNDY